MYCSFAISVKSGEKFDQSQICQKWSAAAGPTRVEAKIWHVSTIYQSMLSRNIEHAHMLDKNKLEKHISICFIHTTFRYVTVLSFVKHS